MSEAQRQATIARTVLGTGIAKKRENMGLDIMWASALMNGEIRLGLGGSEGLR